MSARNVLQKYWDHATGKWIEIHPITSAGNVYNGTRTAKQHMEEGNTAHGGILSPDDPRLTDAREPLEHEHDASGITSGTLSMERLPVAPNGVTSGNHLVRADDQRLNKPDPTSSIQTTDSRTNASTTLLLQAKAMKDHVESTDHDARYARVNHLHTDVIALERLPVANDGQVSGLKLVRADDSRLAVAGNLPTHTIADHSDTTGTTALRNSTSTTLLLQAKAMKDHIESDDHDAKYAAKVHQHNDILDINRLPVAANGTSSNYQLVRADDSRLAAAGELSAHDIAAHTDVSGTTASRDSASTTLLLQAKAMKDHVESDDHDTKYAAKTHNHSASSISEGTLSIDRLPVAASGTSSSTQLVRADDSRLAAAGELTAHGIASHTDVSGMTSVRDSASTTLLLQAKAMKDHVESDDHDTKYATKTHTHTKESVGLGNVDNEKQMPIAGGTFTGNVSVGGKVLENAIIKDFRELIVATTGAINVSSGNVFTITPASNVTFSFSGATANVACSFTLYITMGATVRTVAWPSSVKWDKEKIADLGTANKTYELSFKTIDGGTNWLGVVIGEF